MIGKDACTPKDPTNLASVNATDTPPPCPPAAGGVNAGNDGGAEDDALERYLAQLECSAFLTNKTLTKDPDDGGFGKSAEEVCLAAAHGGCDYEDAPISVWAVVSLCGLVLVPVVWFGLTHRTRRPHPWFKMLLLCLSFISSMFWMDVVAGEAVAVLTALGQMWGLDMAILGLTVLAWGNSIGDLVADLSVARAGSPNMAVTACFAGPLFNMLVGLGVSFFVQCAATGGPVRVDYSTGVKNTTLVSLTVSFVGLAGILCATALAGGVGGFRLRKWWIWPLMGYYSSYMLAEVIIAFVQGN